MEKHVGGVVIAPISGLLPSVQSAVKEALQPDGWNNTKLNEIVRSEFGFLGPFIHATIEDRSSGDGHDEPWLILEFTPPEDRDLGAAEQAFDRATRRAERGEVRPAQKTLRKLVTDFPEIAKYHRALGQTYLVLSDLDDAEDHFLHALALDPRDVDALTLLGNLYMQRERAADAIPLYERSIALQPSVFALANLGAALAKTNRVPEAIASFHRAIALDDTYPNAWYGLGLALSELGTVDALREAIGALERALTTSMGKQETRPVYQESQRLLASLSPAVAQGLVQEAQSTIAATISEQAERFGVPIKLEHEDLPGIDAKIEYAWVHHRPFHRLITGTRPSPAREHHALHELEHLRLTNAARAAGRNRWFGSSMEGSQRAVTAMGNDLARLANQGIPPAQLAQYSQSLVSGLLLQLYNFPLDLLIETRLLETHPELREVFFTSVHQQLATSTRLVEDHAIRQQTPKIIHRASMAMNGAFVLWFDQHYPNRTDFLARFSRSDVWPLAKQLYRMWTERTATWTPGDELDWVDEWATKLGTKDWYQWVDGNTESAST